MQKKVALCSMWREGSEQTSKLCIVKSCACAHSMRAVLPYAQVRQVGNITTHECGATAHLPTFLKPGVFSVRATFHGNELTDQVTVNEGKPLPNRIQVRCLPAEVVAGSTVSCALRASDSFGNELRGAALAGGSRMCCYLRPTEWCTDCDTMRCRAYVLEYRDADRTHRLCG